MIGPKPIVSDWRGDGSSNKPPPRYVGHRSEYSYPKFSLRDPIAERIDGDQLNFRRRWNIRQLRAIFKRARCRGADELASQLSIQSEVRFITRNLRFGCLGTLRLPSGLALLADFRVGSP